MAPSFDNKADGLSNGSDPQKYDGVYGECPAPPAHDLASIGPNDTPKPTFGKDASHLFGDWSD